MSTNVNSVKNHPGFLAFRGANVKVSTKDTQVGQDEQRDKLDNTNNNKIEK